jgi:hypothetical protein
VVVIKGSGALSLDRWLTRDNAAVPPVRALARAA